MVRIFISYRRQDSDGWAGRLYDWLIQHFGRENVFMDVTIEPGLNFVEVIEQAVGSCDALIAVIGSQWLTITDASGRRRLDDSDDFVRLEIAAALTRNIRVIPALVQGAPMPRSSDLPKALKMLAQLHAIKVTDTQFHDDVDRLIEVLDKVLLEATLPEMIPIPAGEFLMGSDSQQDENMEDDEQPQHRLFLPDYYLAKTPVTNAQYSAFVLATGREAPQGWTNRTPPRVEEDQPVVDVSWYDARDYCQWLSEKTGRGYDLPSEAEWEKGARGTEGRIYPWGNQWDAMRCNSGESGLQKTTSVHAYPQSASPYDLLDMAGNVWEWTRSLCGQELAQKLVQQSALSKNDSRWIIAANAGVVSVAGAAVFPPWGALILIPAVLWALYARERPRGKYPYNPKDGRENTDACQDVARVVRGGSAWDTHNFVRCAYRGANFPNIGNRGIGFRVVMYS